jgi:glycosyltransferase involved in cell wall biosynthesis
LEGAVDKAVDDLQPSALILRSTLAHLIFKLRPRIRTIVLDAHDSDVVQAQSLLDIASPLGKPGAWARLQAARRTERLMAQADELWTPSQRELEYFADSLPGLPALWVPNGVPVNRSTSLPFRTREPELLLVAGFGYPPNVAAATRLVESILPRVRERVPTARVTLVGRDLPPRLKHRWSTQPVSYLGVVEDIQPLYDRAAAMVLAYDPSTRSGTPLKIAEAMANSLPVIATPNATSGLGLTNGAQVLTATTDADLADAVTSVLLDRALAGRLAEAGWRWARENLTPERIAARLANGSRLARTGSV